MNKKIAIIPARGGSKRLPHKNLKEIGDKPLICHTIEAVIETKLFDKIILSSDSKDILQQGEAYPELTLEDRTIELSHDKSKVIELVYSIIRRDSIHSLYDIVGLFLPTCPFRRSQHIKEGIALLHKDDLSVVSIAEMNDPIQLSLTLDQDNLINPEAYLQPSPLVTGQTRSQDFKTNYRVNGGFYIGWIKKLLLKENFFQGQVKGYIMPQLNSIDIDYPIDAEWANFLIKNNYV